MDHLETITKINKFKLKEYKHLVTATKLKSFGIDYNPKDAVAWSFQAHNHSVVMLYDIRNYTPCNSATEKQKEKFNDYIECIAK